MMVLRVAALMCSRSEDGRWWSDDASSSNMAYSTFLLSRRAKRVHRIPSSTSRKTTPAAMAMEIRMTTPTARKSVEQDQKIVQAIIEKEDTHDVGRS